MCFADPFHTWSFEPTAGIFATLRVERGAISEYNPEKFIDGKLVLLCPCLLL